MVLCWMQQSPKPHALYHARCVMDGGAPICWMQQIQETTWRSLHMVRTVRLTTTCMLDAKFQMEVIDDVIIK